jgi:hypothetical protein
MADIPVKRNNQPQSTGFYEIFEATGHMIFAYVKLSPRYPLLAERKCKISFYRKQFAAKSDLLSIRSKHRGGSDLY